VIAAIALVGLLLFPVSSRAAYLDFNMDGVHPPDASIYYSGGNNPLYGFNISVDSVVGIGTTSNAGITTTITGGRLDFQTGNFAGFVSGTLNQWIFSPGGTIAVTENIGGGPVTLLSGEFTEAVVIGMTNNTFKLVIGSFTDYKHSELTELYGFSEDIPYWIGHMNLSFFAPGDPPNPFESTYVLSGNIVNTPVPVPTSILLLATGVLGLVFLKRKSIK